MHVQLITRVVLQGYSRGKVFGMLSRETWSALEYAEIIPMKCTWVETQHEPSVQTALPSPCRNPVVSHSAVPQSAPEIEKQVARNNPSAETQSTYEYYPQETTVRGYKQNPWLTYHIVFPDEASVLEVVTYFRPLSVATLAMPFKFDERTRSPTWTSFRIARLRAACRPRDIPSYSG
eukprot:1188029-Prorocentrum_minimum.AAC.6